MKTIRSEFRLAAWTRVCCAAVAVAAIAAPALADTSEREARPIGAPSAGAAPAVGGASTMRTVLSLGVVVALIAAGGVGVRVLAKMGMGKTLGAAAGAPSGVVEVLARYPAGRGLTLLVLKIDRRVLLLGQVVTTTGRVESVNTLTTFDDATDVASLLAKTQDEQGQSLSAKFRELMSGFNATRSSPDDAGVDEDAAIRGSARTSHGDEINLIRERDEERDAAGTVGAFRQSLSALRTTGGRA